MAKIRTLTRNHDGAILCTNGEWHTPDEIGFGWGNNPKKFKTGGGIAAKQRSLDFGTTVVITEED